MISQKNQKRTLTNEYTNIRAIIMNIEGYFNKSPNFVR